MGGPIALNIRKAGFPLTVFNRNPRRTEALAAVSDARIASSLRELAGAVDVVCSCVTGPRDVEQIYLGEDGLVANMHAGSSLAIDMSTIDPGTHRRIAQSAHQRGIGYLDAPVSGGVSGAREGTLTTIVGGDPADLERARPVLESMARRIYHAGPVGAGATAKLINQLIVSINAIAAIEGLVLGTRAGLEPGLLHEILTNSSANSGQLAGLKASTLVGNFEPGFTIDNMEKDVGLSLQLGKDLHVPLYAASIAQQYLHTAQAIGLGDRASAAQIIPLERLLGIEVRAERDRVP